MNETDGIALSTRELREVARFAAECAQGTLKVFEGVHPNDRRPRDAVEAALTFAGGGRRNKVLRDTAWAALEAARSAETAAADSAARAAMCAASAAYLHPIARASQVKHILGAAAYAARATELSSGDRDTGDRVIEQSRLGATPAVVEVLGRYPSASPGGGRVGELIRNLDDALRRSASP